MAKVKYIPCDIYKRGITIFIGEKDEFIAYCKKTFNEDSDDEDFVYSVSHCAYGYADFHYGNGYGVVRIPSFPKTPIDIAAAAHEILHATMWLLWFSGVEYDDKNCNNEAFTYLHEHLIRNTFEEEGYKDFTIENK